MKFKFKPFSSGSSENPPNSQETRRDQVRRAQKTHRERKEAYTKSLEAEVVQLRANEANILQETRNLYAEITVLKQILTQHGIPIPAKGVSQAHSGSTSPEQLPFDFNIGQDTRSKNRKQRIHVQRPEGDHHHREYVESPPNLFHLASPSSSVSPPVTDLANLSIHRKNAGDFDPTAIGIEFVLSLESPCLEHLAPGPAGSSNGANGHSLMISATLLHHQPAPLAQRLGSDKSPWQVSAPGIERLLELSSEIPLSEGELTPVQAWDQLQSHPGFKNLEVERLDKLIQTLIKHIKCFGFGGVLDRGVFDNAIFEAFVIGRVF